MNKATVNKSCRYLLKIVLSCPLESYPGMALLDNILALFLTF